MTHPKLERIAQHLAQARAIQDEFEDKQMPAEAFKQQKAHLEQATGLRREVEAEAQLKANEEWVAEPQYKHDMVGGGDIASQFGHGSFMLEGEKKDFAKASFFNYLRKGNDGIKMEEKAALVEDATGLKLIPTDFAGTILKEIAREGVFRNVAFVRPTTKATVDVGSVAIAAGGWGKLETGTTAADGLPATPADKQTITVHDLNALVLLGVDELEDSDENLEEIIRLALVQKFAEQEDDTFANGTGTAQPWGIAQAAAITQGVTAAVESTVVSDDIIKLEFAVPKWARRNGAYFGNSGVEQAVRLLKGTDGHYLWQERLREGEPDRLNGFPWYTMDGLPLMGATGTAVDKAAFFGDARAGYMIADRRQIAVSRLVERYAEVGKVGLLFRHRVGGDVIRPKAFAWLKL